MVIMKIRLANPIESRFQDVEVCVGDYVKVMEWDGIMAKGIVKAVNNEEIQIHQGEFIRMGVKPLRLQARGCKP